MKKIAVIGASRGIGRELVRILSENHQVLAISRNSVNLESLKKETDCKIAVLDISKADYKKKLSNIIREELGELDVLINNAGYLVNKPFLETTLEDIEQTYRVNVFGLIQSCQVAVELMKGMGHIINIGSIGGVQGSVKFPGIGVYSSSKAAVTGYTECLAEELKETDIQVNCLALGAVQTEMLAEAFPGYEAPTSPEEMAEFIANFALNSNKWINGKIIPVSRSTP